MSFFEELKRRNVFRVGIAYGVAAWLLIQVTDIVFPRIGLPDSAVTLVIALLGIGFILALIFAWAFEMTPEGLKKEADVDRAESITPHTSKKLDRVIIAGLALIIIGMGVERFWSAGRDELPSESSGQVQNPEPVTGDQEAEAPGSERTAQTDLADTQRESVAVLPFTSMSSGEDDEYFADGLTEEILNSLAQLPELLVTARTSSFHFKGPNAPPIPEIAQTLGVDHIVEGSVRRAGDRVRITAQLIRASDGFHLWSDTYDRTLEDVFAVQEDIAANIAETLDVVLSEEKRSLMNNSGIRDVEAFIAYQKGLAAFGRAHEGIENATENLKEAVQYFDQALAVAPDLVGARIMKADQRGHAVFELVAGLREESYEGELDDTLTALRNEYSEAILRSPPGNQRDILVFESSIFSDDWSSMQASIQRAMQPGGCPSLNWSMEFPNTLGWANLVLSKAQDSQRCDPLSGTTTYGLSNALLWSGNPKGSLEVTESALAGDRALSFVSFIEDFNFMAHLALGELDVPEVQGPGSGMGFFLFPRQLLRESLLGNAKAAHRMAEEYWASPSANDWSSIVVAAVLGDRERANSHAARIDARPGSAFVLVMSATACACGAPFDLDAAPNFKARIEEADIPWPPPSPINFPDKDW